MRDISSTIAVTAVTAVLAMSAIFAMPAIATVSPAMTESDISNSQTVSESINISVQDSSNGNDIASVSLEIASNDTTDNPFPNGVPGAGGDVPSDPNEDGVYEDVDGDGEATFDDAVALSFVDSSNFSDSQTNALDFDGDGDVDFADAVELAFQ